MAQYQSFPDAAGDSRTLDKLKALKLPDMAGRSFLDVGCNEGFFCGFAHFLGAKRSVGVDHSELFIGRARLRFPDCEFYQQGWEHLPDGPFDVILLASALHYAEDQPALLHRLVGQLSPDGVLVLELGIASSADSVWVNVERGIDERVFPSMAKLREVLEDHAWKWMGRSVSQDGDPVGRHVIHVSRRRPVAYLLLQPPAFGKTSIASRLFGPTGVRVVSGDEQIARIAQGKLAAPGNLQAVINRDFSPFRIDEAIRRIFDAGSGADLVRLWATQGGGDDFALDAYVPTEHHAQVGKLLCELGYLPVQLSWDRVGPTLLPAAKIGERAEAFYLSMAGSGAPRPEMMETLDDQSITGFVDELAFNDGNLVIRGWAVDATGTLPQRLAIRVDGKDTIVEAFDRQLRTDVQRHLQLPHALVGYRATLKIPGISGLQDLGTGFAVYVPPAGRIRLAGRVIKLLADARQPPAGQQQVVEREPIR
jgi:SAM-dependent methyltransferase